jgi:protein Tob/BTG
MHIEIVQAAEFLCRLLQTKLDPDPLSKFKDRLIEVLKARYADHWDTTQPYRGNAYRAISNFSGVMDDALLEGKYTNICIFSRMLQKSGRSVNS